MKRRRLFALLLALVTAPVLAADDQPIADDSAAPPEKPAADGLPTLWIAGDSTVKNREPMRGWGQELGRFIDPAKLNLVDRAIGGRSARTFFREGRWQEIEDHLKPGDWVLIQFGHNDVAALDAGGKYRGSLQGIGDEVQEVRLEDASIERVRSYGWYLRHFARMAKEKGATVVLCSPVPHKRFDAAGKFVPDWEDYRSWVSICVAKEEVFYLDLAGRIGAAYAAMKPEEVGALFADERTHTNAAGALFNARQVIAGLRALHGRSFEDYLNAEGRELK